MSQKFTVNVRFSKHFGTLESLSFWGEGVGGGLYIAAILFGVRSLATLGVVFVLSAVIALLAHLGNPQRSWRASTRVATAWVSRGTVTIGGFLVASVLYLTMYYYNGVVALQAILESVSIVLAILVIIYAGMLLRSMRAIRFWSSVYVPLSFGVHSVATGLVVVWAVAVFRPGMEINTTVSWVLAIAGLIATVAVSLFYLAGIERSEGVRASISRLTRGDLQTQLLLGAGLIGVLIPAVGVIGYTLMSTRVTHAEKMMLLAAVVFSRLYGDFSYRNSIVLAGAYEPIVPRALRGAIIGSRAAAQRAGLGL